jgi:nitrite reductase/ring-hydroxylating ferredoxin subunit
MADDFASSEGAQWTRVVERTRIAPSEPVAVKLRGKHIALFVHDGEVLACNNRCPHEGYPLVEGALDANCLLTCHWHNWKFDLRSGATIYGGDNLRVYPVKVEAGNVYVDVRDPPAGVRIERALAQLGHAVAEFDTARIARELARLAKAGARPEVAIARAIEATHDRLEDGMTHAYAAADAWLALADSFAASATASSRFVADEAKRLTCATEALVYIAYDTLREPPHPYSDSQAPWSAASFAAAVEAQDEDAAIALINGALAQRLRYDDLEQALVGAALAHYNDFGHSLIYLTHVRQLVARLGGAVEAPLLKAWTRSLIHATREDLLPDFRAYGDALAAWRGNAGAAGPAARAAPPAADFEGRSVREALNAAVMAAAHPPLELHFALMEAAARHLLRFDERLALATTNSVADNVGWLDFTHALTFGHALREQCGRYPEFWPQGLLQLAMFVGRNKSYLDPGVAAMTALRQWAVDDEPAFHTRAADRIVDHGLGLPIFPAHLLKTWSAVRAEVAAGLPAGVRGTLLAAVNRLLAARFKERHPLRTARQALAFVAKED